VCLSFSCSYYLGFVLPLFSGGWFQAWLASAKLLSLASTAMITKVAYAGSEISSVIQTPNYLVCLCEWDLTGSRVLSTTTTFVFLLALFSDVWFQAWLASSILPSLTSTVILPYLKWLRQAQISHKLTRHQNTCCVCACLPHLVCLCFQCSN